VSGLAWRTRWTAALALLLVLIPATAARADRPFAIR
jgi:hypothetical protein